MDSNVTSKNESILSPPETEYNFIYITNEVKCMFSLLFTLSCHAVVSMMNVVAKDNVTANGGFGYERFLDT